MRLITPIALVALAVVPILVLVLFYGRKRPGVRRIVPLAIRIVMVVTLTLVVAGAQQRAGESGVDVVFAVDVSDSIGPEGARDAQDFVETALAHTGPDDRAAIVLVGENVAVERGLQAGLARLTHESILSTSATSLDQGILRSLSLFSGERQRRIVLLTDGQETSGDAVEAARVAEEAGAEVFTVPLLTHPSQGEVFIRRIDVPAEVRVDQAHQFNVVVSSTEPKSATVTVFRDGTYYGEDRVRLGPGDNVLSFQGSFSDAGVHRYGVTVATADDPIAVNNESEALVRVTGEPKLLYVAQTPAAPVLDALRTQGFNVDVRSTDSMPTDVGGLIPYDAVIFDNVPAYDMSVPRMEAVEQYVRDTGGGFLMIGGDASFGAGGYYRTPIERTLPVDMDVTSTMKIPSLAMVFVIDKSGSMGAVEVSGTTKLDLVKEAVVSAIEIMNPYYSVGLIAFDADFEWTVPITRAGNREQIISDLSHLSSGGGTVLDGALREALRVLKNEQAAVKHLVVLSDGLTNDADFESIVNELAANSITVSTVSVGSSADRELMQKIAQWGGGRSYHTADSKSVPRIFAAETTIVSRNLIVEDAFVPQIASSSPIVDGIDSNSVPPLEGFVLTYEKPGAQLVMSGTGDNPVLSSWQYGLGRSIAFTSDLRAKWGIHWLGWSGYSQLLAQTVRWAERSSGSSGFDVKFEPTNDRTQLVVDALAPDGSFRNLLELSARVEPPDADPYDVPLTQTSPGRYVATFPSTHEGNYIVTLFGDPETPPQPYGFAVPFAPEYTKFETDFDRLERIAESGGGSMLTPQDAAESFDSSLAGSDFRDNLWRWLLLAAVVLLLVELVFKKLIMPVGSIVTPEGQPVRRAGAARTDEHDGSWIARVLHRHRDAGEPARDVPTYAELRKQVADAYQRETTRPPEKHWFEGGEHNPVAERKIYIARKRRQ